jgi:uncharacterized protein
MALCPSCQAEVASDHAFCGSCGAANVPAAEPAAPAEPPVLATTAPVAVATAPPDVKSWAMWCHLSAFGGCVFPFGNVLGPLIIWLSKKDEIPEVNTNGKEALNFQITMSALGIALYVVFAIVSVLIALVGQGSESAAIIAIVLGILEVVVILAEVAVWLIFVISAGVQTASGHTYRYPFSIRLIK